MQFIRNPVQRGLLRRYCSTSGSSVVEKSRSTTTKGGWTIVEKIQQNAQWSTMSKKNKIFVASYGSIISTLFLTSTYAEGKQYLIAHREAKKNNKITYHKTEYDAVKSGCTTGMARRFIQSVAFPWIAISSSMPMLVMALNKET